MNENPAQMCRKRFFRRCASIFLLSYFLGYIALTISGSYLGPYPPTGKQKIENGVWLLQHQYVWQPYGTRLDRFGKINFFGAIYAPLILLDRSMWHQDKFAL